MLDALIDVSYDQQILYLTLTHRLHDCPGHDITGKIVNYSEKVMPQPLNAQCGPIFTPDAPEAHRPGWAQRVRNGEFSREPPSMVGEKPNQGH